MAGLKKAPLQLPGPCKAAKLGFYGLSKLLDGRLAATKAALKACAPLQARLSPFPGAKQGFYIRFRNCRMAGLKGSAPASGPLQSRQSRFLYAFEIAG